MSRLTLTVNFCRIFEMVIGNQTRNFIWMRNLIFLLSFLYCSCFSSLRAQQRCGVDEFKKILEQKIPGFKQRFESRTEEINQNALRHKALKTESSTTGEVTLPVVFHIVVNESQYNQLGGKWGIEERCRTQIDVLNEDFNHQNFDSSLVPEFWKPLYANVGFHFALAHTDPNGYPSPGYTIRLTSRQGICCLGGSFDSAKFTDYGGTDAWDVSKYINIWCMNFDDATAQGLLGVTMSPSTALNSGISADNVGICVTYNCLGRNTDTSASYPYNGIDGNFYDLGRTVTHEMGHMFEIWHVWGDDGGYCPWDPAGRAVLPDIPPQTKQTEINPVYTIPGGTIHDGCSDSMGIAVQPIGIACLDFMDYTDDQGMHLFTPDQAAVMQSMVLDPTSESYSLTQHPEVLQWPSRAPQSLGIFPNPTTGPVFIYYDDAGNPLQDIDVYDVAGKKEGTIMPNASTAFSFDLSKFMDGFYILKLRFQKSIITQQIVVSHSRK